MTSFAIEIKCLYIALINIVKTNVNYHVQYFLFLKISVIISVGINFANQIIKFKNLFLNLQYINYWNKC